MYATTEWFRAHLGEGLKASDSAVERDVGQLLTTASAFDESSRFRLDRYQRKVDVARRVMAAYDLDIRVAAVDREIGSEGYVGLGVLFLMAAERQAETDPATGLKLRWLNSAFHCLDKVARGQEIRATFESLLVERLSAWGGPP